MKFSNYILVELFLALGIQQLTGMVNFSWNAYMLIDKINTHIIRCTCQYPLIADNRDY